MNQYIIGTEIQLTATFKDLNGNLVDPTTVTGEILAPDSTTAALTVARASLGIYNADVEPLLNGLYIWRMAGTGAVVAAAESTFQMQSSFS